MWHIDFCRTRLPMTIKAFVFLLILTEKYVSIFQKHSFILCTSENVTPSVPSIHPKPHKK